MSRSSRGPKPMNWEMSDAMRTETQIRVLKREIARVKKEKDKINKLRKETLRKELELTRKKIKAEDERVRREREKDARDKAYREAKMKALAASAADARARNADLLTAISSMRIGDGRRSPVGSPRRRSPVRSPVRAIAPPPPPPPPLRRKQTPRVATGPPRIAISQANLLAQFKKVTKKENIVRNGIESVGTGSAWE